MNYSAERYLALKQFEREQQRDKIRAALWNVTIGGLYAMVLLAVQVYTGGCNELFRVQNIAKNAIS